MPDGTGFKGSGVDGLARKGDLKVVIGISQQGNICYCPKFCEKHL